MNESSGISQNPSAHAACAYALCHLLQVFVLFPPQRRRMEQMVPGKSCLWMCLAVVTSNKLIPSGPKAKAQTDA